LLPVFQPPLAGYSDQLKKIILGFVHKNPYADKPFPEDRIALLTDSQHWLTQMLRSAQGDFGVFLVKLITHARGMDKTSEEYKKVKNLLHSHLILPDIQEHYLSILKALYPDDFESIGAIWKALSFPDFLLDAMIEKNNIETLLIEAQGDVKVFLSSACELLPTFMLIPGDLVRIYKINIKLARYLAERPAYLKKLDNEDFKHAVNYIAEQINRERTWYPLAKRVGEDEKVFTFDLLFEDGVDVSRAKEIFKDFFYNSPDRYAVALSNIQKLLEFLAPRDLLMIIRLINENPKESLEELQESLKTSIHQENKRREAENASLPEDKRAPLIDVQHALDHFQFIVSNMFVLEEQLKKLSVITRKIMSGSQHDLEISRQAMKEFITQLQSANQFKQLKSISDKFNIPLVDVIRLKIDTLANRTAREQVVVQVLNNLQENVKTAEEQNSIREMILNGVSLQGLSRIESKLHPAARKIWQSLFQEARSKADLEEDEDIVTQEDQGQIPHVFFVPLYRIGLTDDGLATFLRIIRIAGKSKKSSTSIKNKLYEAVSKFAIIQNSDKSNIFMNIMRIALEGMPDNPSEDQINLMGSKMLRLLDAYQDLYNFQSVTSDMFKKGSSITFEDMQGWAGLIQQAFETGYIMDFEGFIKGVLEPFNQGLLLIVERTMHKKLEKLGVHVFYEDPQKLKDYLESSNGKRTDYTGQNMISLIDYFISRDTVTFPLADVMYHAMMEEAQGQFASYKFSSPDYIHFLNGLVALFAQDLPMEEQAALKQRIGKADGTFEYQKLGETGPEEFQEIKARIDKIRHGWESIIASSSADGRTAKFTHDFWELLNIGNYPGSTACQTVTNTNIINQGLAGYIANGTVKAVTFVDSEGRIVPARRIVKILLAEIDGKKQPVIFVEENDQFTSVGIEQLYRLLDELSSKTGLPVVTWNGNRFSEEMRGKCGDLKKAVFYDVHQGRYAPYSDAGVGFSGNSVEAYVKYPQTKSQEISQSQAMAGGYSQLALESSDRAMSTEILRGARDAVLDAVVGVHMHRRETVLGLRSPLNMLGNFLKKGTNGVQKGGTNNPSRENGGIDLSQANSFLQTKNGGQGIRFRLNPALLKQLQNALGFVPVIINIQPMKSLKEFLGLANNI
ncbi:MAG: hypothetical protein HQL13_00160, partial [Candidatus Omnitrophica bacterium]|nr:hypothetical protein [Candidatus Omnitrophota bacterium]